MTMTAGKLFPFRDRKPRQPRPASAGLFQALEPRLLLSWGWLDDFLPDLGPVDDIIGIIEDIQDSNENEASPGGGAAPPAGQVQVVRADRQHAFAAPGGSLEFDIQYDTSTADNTLMGLGLRLHFNSSVLTFQGLSDVLTSGLIGQDAVPQPDLQNYDGDPSTDVYVQVAWQHLAGAWPDVALPAPLYQVTFDVAGGLAVGEATNLRFSASSSPAGYGFSGVPTVVTTGRAGGFDADGNGQADALTDGILILRHMFGFTGDALTDRAVAPGSARPDGAAVNQFLNGDALLPTNWLDVDGDGRVDALTDGVLIGRGLFGFTGENLVRDALAPGAVRREAREVLEFIRAHQPTAADRVAAEVAAAAAAWQQGQARLLEVAENEGGDLPGELLDTAVLDSLRQNLL